MTPAESIPQIADGRGRVAAPLSRRSGHQQHQTRSTLVLEREIESLSARVEELEREKEAVEAFAVIAAHELAEPLVMTEAYASMVSDRLDTEQHADSCRDLDALRRGTARMRLLVETLLHDARSSGRSLVRTTVALERVVRDSLELLGPDIEARDAHVEVDPLPTVWGEDAMLSSLFNNLVINALKYSPRQGTTIRVGAARTGDVWRFEVESEGPTIRAEDRERIFEPFHRGRGERRARGAGLGLAICRRIVERHGGQIGVDAAPAGGNVFFFTLPA